MGITAPETRLPPGRTPWDPINGLRIGALAGGLLGAAVTSLTSFATIWLIAVGGVIGGVVGYFHEKRKLQH